MEGCTHCPRCHLDIPFRTWVSDVCPEGIDLLDGTRINGVNCPIFECESFRYPPRGKGSHVETLPEGKSLGE